MIKFRAWDKRENTMRDVAVLHFTKGGKVNSIEYWKTPSELKSYHVRNLILMQSTGLKDKNGVEIFEGDIVILTSKSINYADTYWHNYAEVFQQPNGAYRLRGKGMYETELYGNRKRVTLTGNVYETPELLENDRFCTETDDPDY